MNTYLKAVSILLAYGLFHTSLDAQTEWNYSLLENSTSAYGIIKTQDGILYAGTGRDGRIFTSIDDGESWDLEVELDDSLSPFILTLLESSNGDIYAGTRPGVITHGAEASIFRKKYGESEWTELSARPTNHNSIVITARFNSLVELNGNIYAGVSAVVQHGNGQVDARGEVWRLENDNFYVTDAIGDNNTRSVNSLLVDGNNIYAGTETYAQGEVYKSENGGLKWEKLGKTLIDARAVRALAKDENGSLYAGSNHLFKLESGNEEWQRITMPTTHGIGALKIGSDGALYAGTYGEIFKTLDHGKNWESIGKLDGADLVRDIDEYDDRLYAATNSNGTGAIFKSSPQLNALDHHTPPSSLHYTIYPNPVPYGSLARLQISLPQGTRIASIHIYNILGQLVKSLEGRAYTSDIDLFDGKDMHGNLIAPGVYLVAITTRDVRKQVKIESSKLIYIP